MRKYLAASNDDTLRISNQEFEIPNNPESHLNSEGFYYQQMYQEHQMVNSSLANEPMN